MTFPSPREKIQASTGLCMTLFTVAVTVYLPFYVFYSPLISDRPLSTNLLKLYHTQILIALLYIFVYFVVVDD